MRLIRHLLVVISSLAICSNATAQMELTDLTSNGALPKVSFADSIRLQSLKRNDYFSQAQYRHERELIRKERNFLEINSSIRGSLTDLNREWIETTGGENSMTLLASFYLKHIFTKNLFSIQTIASANFGYYRMMLETTLDTGDIEQEHVWFKNQDEMQLEITPSRRMSKNWSYGASVKFRSQFTKGYVSSASQEWYNLKSDFMAPGYLDVSGGLIYACPSPKFPLTVTLSPVAMSAIYVTNSQIRENAQYKYLEHTNAETYTKPYGVDPNSSSKYEGGVSLQLYFDKKFGKNDFIRYTTTVYSFYGWMSQVTHKNIYKVEDEFDLALEEWTATHEGYEPMLSLHPTLRWENKIEIAASKYISTCFNYQLYYNRAQSSDFQRQMLLTVGLTYTFKNK